MDALEEDADFIRQHWKVNGTAEQPAIFLYTGGMGYWLPEFHVFETLVDYRHGCGPHQINQKFSAAHYVQDLEVLPFNILIRDIVLSREDVAQLQILSPTYVALGDGGILGYQFGPHPTNFRFPSDINGAC